MPETLSDAISRLLATLTPSEVLELRNLIPNLKVPEARRWMDRIIKEFGLANPDNYLVKDVAQRFPDLVIFKGPVFENESGLFEAAILLGEARKSLLELQNFAVADTKQAIDIQNSIMEEATSRKNIEQLFGAYFHQDWHQDAPTWEKVVEHYVRDEPGQGRIAASELEQLLSAYQSDEDVSYAIEKLGCFYWVGSAKEMRIWASQVIRLLREIDH